MIAHKNQKKEWRSAINDNKYMHVCSFDLTNVKSLLNTLFVQSAKSACSKSLAARTTLDVDPSRPLPLRALQLFGAESNKVIPKCADLRDMATEAFNPDYHRLKHLTLVVKMVLRLRPQFGLTQIISTGNEIWDTLPNSWCDDPCASDTSGV